MIRMILPLGILSLLSGVGLKKMIESKIKDVESPQNVEIYQMLKLFERKAGSKPKIRVGKTYAYLPFSNTVEITKPINPYLVAHELGHASISRTLKNKWARWGYMLFAGTGGNILSSSLAIWQGYKRGKEQSDPKQTAKKIALTSGLLNIPRILEEYRAWKESGKMFVDSGLLDRKTFNRVKTLALASHTVIPVLTSLGLGLIAYKIGKERGKDRKSTTSIR